MVQILMRSLASVFLLGVACLVPAFGEGGPGPEGGHRTMRTGLDAGFHETLGPTLGFQYRFAFHDFLDRQTSYPEFTQLEIAGFRVEATPRSGTLFFDELTLVRFSRLQPLTRNYEELSWILEAGGRSVREAALCTRCGAGNLLAAIGATVMPFGQFPLDAWVMLETEFLGSPAFAGFFIKPSVGARAGVRLRLAPWLNGMVFARYLYTFAAGLSNSYQFGTEWRVALGPDWALNARIQRLADGVSATGGFFIYF